MLSPGELQRLAFARVLHQHPAVAILDEATSGLSSAQACRLLALLKRAGIAVLLTAQPGSPLRHMGEKALLLSGDSTGTWTSLPRPTPL
jgi:putative ATP-binding cassette transporter